MKKYLILIIILLFLALGFLGFTLFSRAYTVEPGEYYCDATENGMMTSYAVYTILPDNQLEDVYTGKQGTWGNNPFNKTVTFSGDISLEKALFNQENNSFLATIHPDFIETYRSKQFIITEEGALQCYLAYPPGE